MVSLWGAKNGEEHPEREDGEHTPTRQSGGPEPDERTRLLPPRNDGYLDPDDPAVRRLHPPVFTALLIDHRYHLTIYGASGLSATYASSSS